MFSFQKVLAWNVCIDCHPKEIIGPDNPTCEQLRKIEAAGVKCGRVSVGKR